MVRPKDIYIGQPIRNCTTCKYEDCQYCLSCNKINFPDWEPKGKTNREQLDNEDN